MSKRCLPVYILWIFLFISAPAQPVSAQHGDPPPLPDDAWKGQLSGKVVNQTTGKTVAEAVDVMLHAWDTEEQERVMLHGKTELDGTFRFENVDFHQTFSYSVMVTYLGASYFSQPVNVQKGDTSLTIDTQVYDTTSDLSGITIDQLHVLFYIEEGQLGVTQFYAISNSGDRTVKDAVVLPSDRTGTLKLNLPDEAQHVQFGNDSTGNRYVLLAGGFADTAPIPPGKQASQIIVGYYLPFTGEFPYSYLAPVGVENVIFLVQAGSGLTLQGDGLNLEGEKTLQDGSIFTAYTAPSLAPGESISLTLEGQRTGVIQKAAAIVKNGKNAGLGIGSGMLGLSLLVAGFLWWRRQKGEDVKEISANTFYVILAEIQDLDQAYTRGNLSDEEYQVIRADLVDRLKAVVNLPKP